MSVIFDTYFISFYVSLLGIIGMISFKASELKTGKKYWISRFTDRTNHSIRNFYNHIRRYISYINKKSAIALIELIAYYILSWARNLYIWAYKKAHNHAPSKKVIDMVRGKGDLKRSGGSSLYLKKISEKDIVEEAVK